MNTQHYQIILSKHFMHSMFMLFNIAMMTVAPFNYHFAWMTLSIVFPLYFLMRMYHTLVYMLFGIPTGIRFELSAHLPIFYDSDSENRKSFTFFACYQVFALFVCIDNVSRSFHILLRENSIFENAVIGLSFWLLLSLFAQKVGRIVFATVMNDKNNRVV